MTATDTIVAAATPPGQGGVAIVRLSGPDVETIGGALIGRLPAARTASLREIRGEALIDTGLVLYFPAPNSFTGEEVLELHCHGGPLIVEQLIARAVAAGARRAEPGEFSKRAFLNGKLDLAQAEAIADLIASSTAQAARAAQRALSGEFSAAVNALLTRLTELRVYVEAAIDFPDDDIDFLSDAELSARLDDCAAAFDVLAQRTQQGRILRDGYQLVLVGRPNAGKSSLMNRLSGEDTAIVTEIAGTTRDILRETIDIDGLAVELVDTAGLRDDPGVIEEEGIRRAKAAMASADAVLWVQDATEAPPPRPGLPEGIPVLIVRNKTDLVAAPGEDGDAVNISAVTGAGLDTLRARIRELAGYSAPGEGAYTARRRHVEAIGEARAHFTRGREALESARAGELLAEELRLAQDALGRITGAVSSDELLGHIFSAFCIGK